MAKTSSICKYKALQKEIVDEIDEAFAYIWVSPVIYDMNVKIEGGNGKITNPF